MLAKSGSAQLYLANPELPKYIWQIMVCPNICYKSGLPKYLLQIRVCLHFCKSWSGPINFCKSLTIALAYPRMHEIASRISLRALDLCSCWHRIVFILLQQLAKHWHSVSKTPSIYFQLAILTLGQGH